MINLKTAGLATALAALMGTSALADCGIESGDINILANDFPPCAR